MTIVSNILKKIGRGWVHGGTLERMDVRNRNDVPVKPSNISRRLREMVEDGFIIKRYVKGYVQYKKI